MWEHCAEIQREKPYCSQYLLKYLPMIHEFVSLLRAHQTHCFFFLEHIVKLFLRHPPSYLLQLDGATQLNCDWQEDLGNSSLLHEFSVHVDLNALFQRAN